MTYSGWIASIIALAAVIYIGLTLYNPPLADYQLAILSTLADQQSERSAATDRLAIEAEAARLMSLFVAAQYNLSRLDTLRVQSEYPLFGKHLTAITQSSTRSLTETLSHIKEQALNRVLVTHHAIRSSIIADLMAHTERDSYGVWSTFSTCTEKIALSYIGLAGKFYERSQHACQAAVR